MISIPRDTMTEVESFDLEGNSLGTSTDHISLSYGYGDGGQKSCKLTQEAVENLMYGVPIQGFFALNLDGLPELSKSVGGITVTVPDDSLVDQHPERYRDQSERDRQTGTPEDIYPCICG